MMEEQLAFSSGLVVGARVYDDLTGLEASVVQLTTDNQGNPTLQLDNDHLDGWRLLWEVSPPGTTVMFSGGRG